ncbi:uncharacterized protein TNCV_4645791 [Trichonephila clavipes]|nr:uncharacterized protein TNCV_4645791 [Trichonephila clavipes]
MTTGEQKAFRVPQFAKTESAITAQRAFRWTPQWTCEYSSCAPLENFVLQDGAPPHWRLSVPHWLNITVLDQWIFRKGPHDKACFALPPRSPNLTPCDIYLWGFIKNSVYVPALPADLSDLRPRIEAAVASITADTLNKVWEELTYILDIYRAKNGARIEHFKLILIMEGVGGQSFIPSNIGRVDDKEMTPPAHEVSQYRLLHETHSVRHDAGRRRAVRSSSLEESM